MGYHGEILQRLRQILSTSNTRHNDATTAEVINGVSNQLLKATSLSSFDNRFLRNTARKWSELSDIVERGEYISGDAKATR